MGESFEPGHWSVDMEVNLFHAMRGHKPVGVNRHFNMVSIYEKLCNPNTKALTAQNVWEHLATMYDLQALNESEIIPFPNKQADFKLPDGEYSQLADCEFPRVHRAAVAPSVEESKARPEVTAQPKGSKSESKTPNSGKADHKMGFPHSEAKGKTDNKSGSQTSSKTDSKASTPVSSRAEGKSGKGGHSTTPGDSKTSTPVSSRAEGKSGKGGHSTTPNPSPAKRTKRSRNTPSSAVSSPASEGGTLSAKRRR